MHEQTAPHARRAGYSVRHAAAEIDVSERLFWQEIKRGNVRIVRMGRRTIVPGEELARLMQAKSAE